MIFLYVFSPIILHRRQTDDGNHRDSLGFSMVLPVRMAVDEFGKSWCKSCEMEWIFQQTGHAKPAILSFLTILIVRFDNFADAVIWWRQASATGEMSPVP